MSLQKTVIEVPAYRQRLSYHSMLLGGIGFLTGAALVIAHVETHEAIEYAKAEEKRVSLTQVIPETYYEGNLLDETFELTLNNGEKKTLYIARKDSRVTATAYEVSEPGYSGDINILMGVDRDGTILGVRTLNHTETPGLGDKVELAKNDWVLSFNGKSRHNPEEAGWAVKKDGGEFDQFTGATITPRAYVKAIKGGLDLYAANQTAIIEKPLPVKEDQAIEESAETQTAKPVVSGRNRSRTSNFVTPTEAEAVDHPNNTDKP